MVTTLSMCYHISNFEPLDWCSRNMVITCHWRPSQSHLIIIICAVDTVVVINNTCSSWKIIRRNYHRIQVNMICCYLNLFKNTLSTVLYYILYKMYLMTSWLYWYYPFGQGMHFSLRFFELVCISSWVLQGWGGSLGEQYDQAYQLMSPVNKLEVHEAATHMRSSYD